jgi:hypothetical protein
MPLILRNSVAHDLHANAEQRRAERYPFRLPVTLVRRRGEIPLITRDVSYQGLFLETDDMPPLRHLLRMRVLLPPYDRALDAFGMAVHHFAELDREPGVGVQLYALDRAARSIWEDFVTAVRLGRIESLPRAR